MLRGHSCSRQEPYKKKVVSVAPHRRNVRLDYFVIVLLPEADVDRPERVVADYFYEGVNPFVALSCGHPLPSRAVNFAMLEVVKFWRSIKNIAPRCIEGVPCFNCAEVSSKNKPRQLSTASAVIYESSQSTHNYILWLNFPILHQLGI